MRILVVSNMYPSKEAPSYGVFVKNFCEQLEDLHISYDLAVMIKGKGKIEKLFGYLKFYFKSFTKSLFGKYDLVYVHYASHSSMGVNLARKFRKFRIFTNVHGSDVIPENDKQEKMQKHTRRILAFSEKVIVPSEYFKKVVSKKYSLNPERIHVCSSGGVNLDVFKARERDIKIDAPLIIGYIGRISYGKGWNTLLEACARLPKDAFKLVIVGDGPEKKAMLEKIEKLNLKSQVELRGLLPQSQLVDVYNGIDVFAFPTEREGESLGLVALEAMACGVPVIASDFAAPAYYVENGYNGYKFEKGNANLLADRFVEFQDLTIDSKKMLMQGAIETAKKYSMENVTKELESILLG